MGMVTLVLLGWAIMALTMLVLWLVQRATGNAGIVDVGWSGGLGILALLYALLGSGAPVQRLVVALLAGIWSARLALYVLFDRVIGQPEDGRYQTLRRRWAERGADVPTRLLVFFETQAVIVAVMSLPFLVVATIGSTSLRWWQYVAIAVWLVAVAGESLADRQLAGFRADPTTAGTTCRRGLWSSSRHPNYFFEWLHWWTYVILAAGSRLVAADARQPGADQPLPVPCDRHPDDRAPGPALAARLPRLPGDDQHVRALVCQAAPAGRADRPAMRERAR